MPERIRSDLSGDLAVSAFVILSYRDPLVTEFRLTVSLSLLAVITVSQLPHPPTDCATIKTESIMRNHSHSSRQHHIASLRWVAVVLIAAVLMG